MKFNEAMENMTPEERSKVIELLRGKADMSRTLLLSDCEERIKRSISHNSAEAIKAMYMLCDALTRTGKNIHQATVKAEMQDRYHDIADKIVTLVEENSGNE